MVPCENAVQIYVKILFLKMPKSKIFQTLPVPARSEPARHQKLKPLDSAKKTPLNTEPSPSASLKIRLFPFVLYFCSLYRSATNGNIYAYLQQQIGRASCRERV